MYILAFIFPPLAALISGGFFSFLFNVLLTICGVLPGIIHAILVVNNRRADKRTDKLIKAMEKNSQE